MKQNWLLLMALIVSIGVIPACKKSNSTVPLPIQTTATISDPNTASGAMAKNHGVPFKGSVSYTLNASATPCNCGTMSTMGSFDGVGNLTHFGLMHSTNTTCFSPIIVNGVPVGYHIKVPCGKFVTANGDEITVNVHPYDVFFGSTSATGTMTADFAGGTGRFANATGGFKGTITIPFSAPNTATLTNIDGTIDY